MPEATIHTIDARGHVMLEVVRDYFHINPARMRREILALHAETQLALKKKGISYAQLKTALIPSVSRKDLALFFDTTEIEEGFYGYPVAEQVIPCFSSESNHSVLCGDFIGENAEQQNLFESFDAEVTLVRNVNWRHSSQFWVVYINNLTDAMAINFVTSLSAYRPFVGFADLTYSSLLKTQLSFKLAHSYLKHRKIVIMGHEDDRPDDEDVNMTSYPFEENGYTCRSILGYRFGILLSYKIERPVYKGFEVDTEFALNAISDTPLDLNEFNIHVAPEKFKYLSTMKTGSLKRLGLLDEGADALKRLIAAKISSNYIYSLSYASEHATAKFNIILELADPKTNLRFKVMVALAYEAETKNLRLITLY